MILTRRPDRRSVLKNLPREFQQEIMDYLDGTETTPRHYLHDTVVWLATKDVMTSPTSLRAFRDWWETAHALGAEAARRLERRCQEVPDTSLREDHIMKVSQAFFEEQAAVQKNEKLYVALARLRQRDRVLDLQQAALQMRNDLARDRVEIQERLAECRERMTDLAIWKAETEEAGQERRRASGKSAADFDDEKDFDHTELIAAMRKAAFAEIDEIYASGKVVIPK
jgi:hypothetical protein